MATDILPRMHSSPGILWRFSALLLLAGCARTPAAQEQTPQVSERSEQLSQHPTRPQTGNYTLFEAGPVRPIAVLSDGLVAVANIPDDRVELFETRHGGLTQCASIKVGMRPVALAAVDDQLWVANHLSDSVSIVSIDAQRCATCTRR